MKKEDYLKEYERYFGEAETIKGKAISYDDKKMFLEAGNLYQVVIDIFSKIIFRDVDAELTKKALLFYYQFERDDCYNSVSIKEGKYDEAQKYADISYLKLQEALSSINSDYDKVTIKTKEVFSELTKFWTLSLKNTKIKQIEPKAKKSFFDSKNFIQSLDYYREMLKISEEVIEYCNNNAISQDYLRIVKGNHLITSANISQTMVNILFDKIENNQIKDDLSADILKHALNTFKYSQSAFDANPEHDKYHIGNKIVKENIIRLLIENKSKWRDYLIEFENDNELIKIMKNTDYKNYLENQVNDFIDSNPIKKTLVIGGFYLIAMISIFAIPITIALLKISWYWGLLIIITGLSLYSIFVITILRTNDKLSEENYVMLMKIILKLFIKKIRN